MTTSVTVTPLTLRTVLFGGWSVDPLPPWHRRQRKGP
jgi:hypothetical protein